MGRASIALLLVAALAGCGGDDEDGAADRPRPMGAELRIAVRAGGPASPARVRRLECPVVGEGTDTCRRLAALLEPVPRDVACAQVYGGPAVAIVGGTLRGEPVRARFELSDACEIARWQRAQPLLGDPPGR